MISSFPLCAATNLRRKRSRTIKLARRAPPPRLCLIAATSAIGLACTGGPAQFPTLQRPPSPSPSSAKFQVETAPPTLVAPAQQLRCEAVRQLLLALSLGDEDAVADLLSVDGQLTRQQQSLPLTARALMNELETRVKAQGPQPSAPGLLLLGQIISTEGDSSLVVQVEGTPSVRGKWTVVFLDSPVNRIKELRLPPHTA